MSTLRGRLRAATGGEENMNHSNRTSWVSHRAVASLFGAVALTTFVAGQAAAQRQLVMYCGVDEKWCRAVSNAYQKETGVQVDMTRMSAGPGGEGQSAR
jgi:hypothetical protein